MKKKNGFTLAEVLITLGIIGVVAALTMPALVNNSGNARIAPSLAKFTNTFENAMGQMMAKEGMTTLTLGDVNGVKNLTTTLLYLSQNLIMSPVEDGTTYSFTDYNQNTTYTIRSSCQSEVKKLQDELDRIFSTACGTSCPEFKEVADKKIALEESGSCDAASGWNLKDGTYVQIIPRTSYVATSKGAYKGIVAEVLVDIDGNKSVNRAGRDVFAFLLDASGYLIPAGSAAHKSIEQSGTKYVTTYEGTCARDNNLAHNLACTGKIADNGWSTKDIFD